MEGRRRRPERRRERARKHIKPWWGCQQLGRRKDKKGKKETQKERPVWKVYIFGHAHIKLTFSPAPLNFSRAMSISQPANIHHLMNLKCLFGAFRLQARIDRVFILKTPIDWGRLRWRIQDYWASKFLLLVFLSYSLLWLWKYRYIMSYLSPCSLLFLS